MALSISALDLLHGASKTLRLATSREFGVAKPGPTAIVGQRYLAWVNLPKLDAFQYDVFCDVVLCCLSVPG